MSMSRKHFVELAKALRSEKPPVEAEDAMVQWRKSVEAVAEACRAFNERFDFGTFYEACEY